MTPKLVEGLLILSLAQPASAEILSVTVRDRSTGAPVANATILLVSHTPVVRTVLTDDHGEARIDLGGVKTWLSIRSPRHSMRCFAVEDASNAVLVADLDETVRFYGTINDDLGRPVSGAVVRLSTEFDPACRVHIPPQPTQADRNGRYVLRNVDPSKPFAIAFESNGHERFVLDSADVLRDVNSAGRTKADFGNDTRRELNVTLRRR